MAFDIGECFAQQWLVAEVFLPVPGQCSHCVGQRLAGEIGSPGALWYYEAHVVDDKVASTCAHLRVPTNPFLAVFEVVGARGPLNGRYRFPILADKLHQAVADGAAIPERVLFVQPLVGDGFIFGCKGDGHGELTEPLPRCRVVIVGSRRYHGTLTSLYTG